MDPGRNGARRPRQPAFGRDEQAREASIDSFWIDRCAVNNGRFGGFVDETGWVTAAERPLKPSRSQPVWAAHLALGVSVGGGSRAA
jgi:formylglycine-generating enzyme required for sulfatase activity